jgi:hypothetical protein
LLGITSTIKNIRKTYSKGNIINKLQIRSKNNLDS